MISGQNNIIEKSAEATAQQKLGVAKDLCAIKATDITAEYIKDSQTKGNRTYDKKALDDKIVTELCEASGELHDELADLGVTARAEESGNEKKNFKLEYKDGRNVEVTVNDGSIECSTVLPGDYLGLLPAYDYVNASLDTSCNSLASQQCSNYNYLLEYDKSWWLLTADADTTFKGYKAAGEIVKSTISGDSRLRLVITLDSKTILTSGTGSQEDPYIVK